MVDEYVEVTDAPGCFARLKDSIAKVGIGLLMIVISFPLLFWNEGRAVKRAQDLEFGRGSVVSVESDKVDASKSGELVHVTGELDASKPATDPKFKISANAIALERKVEMYQWKENKETKTKGDKKETRYTYVKEWSDRAISSSNFKQPGHDNPSMPAQNETFYSPAVTLGAYAVSSKLASKWPIDAPRQLKPEELSNFPKIRGHAPKLDGSHAYFGDPASATVGDVRISYEIGPPGKATVVGGLEKGTLTPFTHPDMNGDIAMLSAGIESADAMFQAAEDANTTMTWILRLVGFFLMFIGFNLLFGPIDTIVRMIPLIGAVIDFGTTVIALILAGAFSLITIAIGWIFYRPLIGILLLLGASLFIGMGIALAIKAKKDAS